MWTVLSFLSGAPFARVFIRQIVEAVLSRACSERISISEAKLSLAFGERVTL
jgi:hypothetical protein